MKNQLGNDVIERPVEPTCRREFEGLKPPTFPKNRKVPDIDQKQTDLSIVKSYKNSINFKKNSVILRNCLIGALIVGSIYGLHHFMITIIEKQLSQVFAESNLKTAYNTISELPRPKETWLQLNNNRIFRPDGRRFNVNKEKRNCLRQLRKSHECSVRRRMHF